MCKNNLPWLSFEMWPQYSQVMIPTLTDETNNDYIISGDLAQLKIEVHVLNINTLFINLTISIR